MPENSKNREFLQKLAPCIERSDLDACVGEAARVAREMGVGAGELLESEDRRNDKYREPRMNADERGFVALAFSSSLVLVDANQKNNHLFAYFAVKNCANRCKPALERPQNIFGEILKVGVNLP